MMLSRLLSILLAVTSLPAIAATHYLDPTAANGGSGTEGSPYNEFSDITIGAGDTILIKSGTTITGQTLTVTGVANVLVGIYGGTARALIDCNNAVNYGIDITQADEFDFGDVNIKGCLLNNALIDLSGSGTVDVYISNVKTYDITATQTAFSTQNGFYVTGAAGAIGRLNITYTDVDCENVTGHCFDQRQEVFSTHFRSTCKGAGIGEALGAHCFSSSPRIQDWTTGWTLASGTTYYRARVTNVEQEYAMCGRGGTVGDFCAVQQAADDTTLGTGEWSKWANGVGGCASANGCIAVNYGFDPNSTAGFFAQIKNARFPNGAKYYYVEAQGAHTDDGTSSGVEGDGIVCDDLTANCVIGPGCWAHDNQRNGIQLRQTVGARLNSFLTTNNGSVGLLSQASIDTDISNFVTHGNNLGFRVNTDYEKSMVIRNSVATRNTQNWVIDPQSSAQITQSNNVSFAGTNANDNFTASITTDPQYIGGRNPTTATGFKLKPTSPLIGAGTPTFAKYDFSGYRIGIPATIGIYQIPANEQRTSYSTRTNY